MEGHSPETFTGPHSETVFTRGRAYSATSRSSERSQQSHSRSHQSKDAPDRKPSISYGHHRQTSIVHGVQHSRGQGSLAQNGSSPISPQTIYASAKGPSPQLHSSAQIPYLRKSPSASALSSYTSSSNGHADIQGTAKRHGERHPERSRLHKLARDEKHRSSSRHKHRQPELTTVGEYALHHLLTNFIKEADERIERCMGETSEVNINIESICGPGADASFDQLIKALGHIGRDRPRSLIDSVMLWRRGKGVITQSLHREMETVRASSHSAQYNGTIRRMHTQPQNHANASSAHLPIDPNAPKMMELTHEIRRAERRSAISVYILCRALMEIIAQCRPGTLPDETSDRLEDVIWSQVRSTDAHSLGQSTIKQAQWNIFGQLLGVMSGPRFQHIRDRYVNELGALQSRLVVKGHMEAELERKAVLLVNNMSWLKVRITPDLAWEQSCDLIKLLATYFRDVHGRDIKHAYCQLIEDLLLPIAAKATAQFNSMKWRSVLEILRVRINQLLIKPKHWVQAFPLQVVTLCASPAEIFTQHWQTTALNLQGKLRDRSTRSHALKALCRLVWRYLYRIHDPVPTRKIEEIIKMVLQPGKRAILSTEPSIADPLIQLIRIIGFRCQDLVFRSILFPLMNADIIMAGKGESKIDVLEPERMVIGIRAFLAIMTDLEKGEQPKFPLSFECDALMDPYHRSPHSHRRSASQSSMTIAATIDRQSKPIITSSFAESTKNYHFNFCQILGFICQVCDNAFGGQVVLDEKLAQTTPKTPMSDAFAFGRRDEIYSPVDVRQSFYDLLHVAVQALPRCLLPERSLQPTINLLCTGTAHMNGHIASSSAQSLKSISKNAGLSQRVAHAFSNFIFNFDDRYSTIADGGLLGPSHIESTLRLYVELLELWIEQLQQGAKKSSPDLSRNDSVSSTSAATTPLDTSGSLAHVDIVESHGLFFLCSPSRHVRAFAIRVLRLVSKFDQALGQRTNNRIITILEGSTQQVIDVNDEKLTTAERSRLQKGLRKSNVGNTLVELCSSDIPHDSTLWVKVFPGLIRLAMLTNGAATALTRQIVCKRLLHTLPSIHRYAEPGYEAANLPTTRYTSRHTLTPEQTSVEQWKLHLIFACSTLNPGSSSSSSFSASSAGLHSRKGSKPSATGEEISSARELFARVVGYLGASNERVRVAAAVGLGTIGPELFKPLLEALAPAVASCNEDARQRLNHQHQRTLSSPRRSKRTDHMRTEITHLYRLTARCLSEDIILNDEGVLTNIVNFTKELRFFLNDEGVQHQLAHHKLRTHFCGLVEVLYENLGRTKDPLRWMSFQSRRAAFSMMEEWCGYSPNQNRIAEREESMRRSVLDSASDVSLRGGMTAALEIEKKDLRTAALSAMSALCAGPVTMNLEGQIHQFDIRRMLQWIDTIFNDTPSDKAHATGRRALKNLIAHNQDNAFLLNKSIEMCYLAHSQKTLTSYFDVVTQVLTQDTGTDVPFWKVLSAGLYTLGNDRSDIRMKSTHLLRSLEEKMKKSSKLQDLDISVSDRTTAVYKLAQFQISQRLSREHAHLAFHVFSEFSTYFKELQPDHQRNMVSAMLPWLQTVELLVDPNGRPTANSHMLLVNLVEITVRSSTVLHNEIQALWQALATGPHGGNVQVVLDFIIAVCLDRREQNFVDYAKQVVVFLSGTPAGSKVIEFLLMQLTPKAMVNEKPEAVPVPADTHGLPYIADLNQILPMGAKQSGLSLGQLSLMLLVDLIVSPVQLPREKVPILLQTVVTQWDHYTTLVQDQAHEMLVHLIHELVISKIDPDSTDTDKGSIEELIELIRTQDTRVTWPYEDGGNSNNNQVSGVPEPMTYVIQEIVRVFSITFKLQSPDFDIQAEWARTTLDWATSCPVRHIACRSFQIYRCILQNPDQQMLADMLARLSNTIADDDNDYLTFSREILMTLRTIIRRLEPVEILDYPQLFWITAACLDTIYEAEFEEALTMLEQLLDRLDLSDPALIKLFSDKKPESWDGEFEGLHALVYKGLRSGLCFDRSLNILDRMIKLPSSELVGNDNRLLFTTLANLPRFLTFFEDREEDKVRTQAADTLATVADAQGHGALSSALYKFASGNISSESDFLSSTVSAIRLAFFPSQEYDSLVFLIGLLNNQLSWFKVKIMKLLCIILPDVDMRKPEFASQGPDLISPLLRLLQTSFVQQALDVLDNVMSMTGTPLDQKHIRMSMAGSHSSRATRKEYDSTKSLYGIPEESGWSIPMPAIHSARTRQNVQAVVRTCTKPGVVETGTPKIEFKDDRHYDNYFPNDSALVLSPVARPSDGTMSEMVMKLDSLDDFFDDHDDSETVHNSMPRASFLSDERESLYDKHTLPILHKSLDRNASVTSFHASFADTRYTSPREPPIMTPTAFASGTMANFAVPSNGPADTTGRPGLHTRSITSPVAGFKHTPTRLDSFSFSEDDADPNADPGTFDDHIADMSDDDLSLARTRTLDDPYATSTAVSTAASSTAPTPDRTGQPSLGKLPTRHGNGSAPSLMRTATAGPGNSGPTGLGLTVRPGLRRMVSANPELEAREEGPAQEASQQGVGMGQGHQHGAFSPVSTFSPFPLGEGR
ncbi:Cell morphoproteinsis protein PAG1 [Sphaceloma murrayae]|uniref:Cell morphoproteinsis protein PAG1 n=1 Tax=Sphaceloma murrayae TaxID=2082308 RepID=A0A2K1QUU2_9PEZI|nr:Cell morphoproteinsis protein PAG1 [Sphaceloma murrayae]